LFEELPEIILGDIFIAEFYEKINRTMITIRAEKE